MPVIVTISGGPYAAGSTPVYRAQLVDEDDQPFSGNLLNSLTLTLVDVLSGQVINGVSQVNILNAGRGQIDALGNLTVALTSADTSMSETTAPQILRAMVFDYTYNGGLSEGRHQVNFTLLALAGM